MMIFFTIFLNWVEPQGVSAALSWALEVIFKAQNN
jgi:hypothetical protein